MQVIIILRESNFRRGAAAEATIELQSPWWKEEERDEKDGQEHKIKQKSVG